MPAEAIPLSLPAFDRINQKAYQRRGVLRQFGNASGWLEPGERAAIEQVADAVRDGGILDIGIGGGRTAPLLRALSHDYCGVDYTPAMVELARRRFPEIDFRQMDARHLAFPDARFRLAVFSYNGIDSVDPAGREAVLREVWRVLEPGGWFVFSALNRGAAAAIGWPDWSVFRGVGLDPARLLRACAKLVVGGINRARGQMMRCDDGEMSIGNLAAHNFALVTVFTSPSVQLRQLRDVGFTIDVMFAPDGRRIAPGPASESCEAWYYYVAQKP